MDTAQITDSQAQELSDCIADKCDELELEPEQILDGLARILLSAANEFGARTFKVTVDGFGQCELSLKEAHKLN